MRSGAVLPPSELLRKAAGFKPFRLVEVGASGCDLAVTDLERRHPEALAFACA
jgi:hypothetical protein